MKLLKKILITTLYIYIYILIVPYTNKSKVQSEGGSAKRKCICFLISLTT